MKTEEEAMIAARLSLFFRPEIDAPQAIINTFLKKASPENHALIMDSLASPFVDTAHIKGLLEKTNVPLSARDRAKYEREYTQTLERQRSLCDEGLPSYVIALVCNAKASIRNAAVLADAVALKTRPYFLARRLAGPGILRAKQAGVLMEFEHLAFEASANACLLRRVYGAAAFLREGASASIVPFARSVQSRGVLFANEIPEDQLAQPTSHKGENDGNL